MLKKINKSTRLYIIYGGLSILFIILLLLIWAWIDGTDIIAWLGSKYAFLIYGAIMIYLTLGIIFYIRGKIKEM